MRRGNIHYMELTMGCCKGLSYLLGPFNGSPSSITSAASSPFSPAPGVWPATLFWPLQTVAWDS